MFPAVLALVAIYALFDKIGDYIPWLGLNTHGGLILAYMGGIALHVWTIKGYFETIDPSLEEARITSYNVCYTKLLRAAMNARMKTTARMGTDRGNSIRRKACHGVAPSMEAASSSEGFV